MKDICGDEAGKDEVVERLDDEEWSNAPKLKAEKTFQNWMLKKVVVFGVFNQEEEGIGLKKDFTTRVLTPKISS